MGTGGCNLQAHLTKKAEIATDCISIGAIFTVAGFASALHYIPSPTILSSHEQYPRAPKRRRRTAPAPKPSVIFTHSCPNQSDLQQIPSLPMGVGLHLPGAETAAAWNTPWP